jgi:hypothetical protein
MELGWLVQCIVRGQVLSTSGIQRPVVNSFVYSVNPGPPILADKALYWAAFHTGVWNANGSIAARLTTAYVGVHGDVLYPNVAGDTQLSVGVPANGGAAAPRLPLNTCVYCKLGTGLRTRPFVGAKRFAPISAVAVQNDHLTVLEWNGWNVAVSTLLSVLNITSTAGPVVTMTPVVWSRSLSALDTTVPPAVGGVIQTAHVNLTLGQWKHRRERVVR